MSLPSAPQIPAPIQVVDPVKIKRRLLSLKLGILGDAQVGKTTLMVKYVKSKFDMTYIETFGINTMDKIINLYNADIHCSIWELGGQKQFSSLMPVVCCDAKAILFVFDLTQKPSLLSIKKWYKDSRKENKKYLPFLIGTKFDLFEQRTISYKIDVSSSARKYAQKMGAPLIYCSSSQSINVRKIFKLIIAKLTKIKPKIKEQIDETKGALIEFSYIDHQNRLYNKQKNIDNKKLMLRNHGSFTGKCHGNKYIPTNVETDCDENVDDHKKEELSSHKLSVHKNHKKYNKKRVKRIKSRLDFLLNDEDKLKEIEDILGISL